MTILGREIAVWIGIIVSVVLAVVSSLQGNGVIGEALAGKITDATNALAQILVIVAPLITAVLIRGRVTPTSSPALPQGTTVTVVTPGDAPNQTKVL